MEFRVPGSEIPTKQKITGFLADHHRRGIWIDIAPYGPSWPVT